MGRPPDGRGGARVHAGRGQRTGTPQTAAERRADQVNATRPPRPPPDPDAERMKIESRTLEEWIDEGALRAEASHAATRASAPAARRPDGRTTVAPDTSAAISAAARDAKRAEALTARLAQAQDALDRERFDDARRIATSLLRELPNVAAVHEVLGLAAYRAGRWKQAATELEAAQQLHPTIELLPVLADVYRAQRRWDDVDRIWDEVRAASPAQEVLAEARIVAAGAQADQGDLSGALSTMDRADPGPDAGPRPPPPPVVRPRRPPRPGRRHARGHALVRARRSSRPRLRRRRRSTAGPRPLSDGPSDPGRAGQVTVILVCRAVRSTGLGEGEGEMPSGCEGRPRSGEGITIEGTFAPSTTRGVSGRQCERPRGGGMGRP